MSGQYGHNAFVCLLKFRRLEFGAIKSKKEDKIVRIHGLEIEKVIHLYFALRTNSFGHLYKGIDL